VGSSSSKIPGIFGVRAMRVPCVVGDVGGSGGGLLVARGDGGVGGVGGVNLMLKV
jgi:hypothetical protein